MGSSYAPLPDIRRTGGTSEYGWPTQHLGVALIALAAATTTGVPAHPVLDSQLVIESFTGTWLEEVQKPNFVSAGVATSADRHPHPDQLITPSRAGQANTADTVKRVRAESGLTWDQLARIFGVSRRAVHHWASGGRMNAVNEEQLNELQDVIRQLPGGDPATRRSMIFASTPEGPSIFEQLKSRRSSSEILQVAAYSPDGLIG